MGDTLQHKWLFLSQVNNLLMMRLTRFGPPFVLTVLSDDNRPKYLPNANKLLRIKTLDRNMRNMPYFSDEAVSQYEGKEI
jgi:hypothetical protein